MEKISDVTAQELSMHMAMCVVSDYISSWGLEDFLIVLGDYIATEQDMQDLEIIISALSDGEEPHDEHKH